MIDVMHNLILVTGKCVLNLWIEKDLSKEKLAELDTRVSLFQIPSGYIFL